MFGATLPICVKGTSLVPTFTGNFVMIFFRGDLSSFLDKQSKTCLKRPLKQRPNIGLQDRLSFNAGQK